MKTDQPEKLVLASHDIADNKRRELLRLFPEVATDGRFHSKWLNMMYQRQRHQGADAALATPVEPLALAGNDQPKANAVQIFRTQSVAKFQTV